MKLLKFNRNIWAVIFSIATSGGCSDGNFAGGNLTNVGSKKNQVGNNNDSSSNSNNSSENNLESSGGAGGENQLGDGTDSGELGEFSTGSGGEGSSQVFITEAESEKECWFAVSGTFMGRNVEHAKSSFPKAQDGTDAGPGKIFDVYGGVFLSAREEAYVYGQGGKEIDKAIQKTFDSIAIAPGMHAVVKNGSGTVILDAEGPLFRYSNHYIGRVDPHFQYMKSRNDLPDWMQKYFQNDANIAHAALQSARSVEVSVIPNSKCDWDAKN